MLRRAALMAQSGLTSAGVVDGEIQDDWPKIIEIAKARRAGDFYSLGDKKSLSWGWQGTIDMILVGIDEDDRADGLGKANMTWMGLPLSKKAHYGSQTFGATTADENNLFYDRCMISFYMDGLISLLPKELQNGIVKVNKTFTALTIPGYQSITKTGAFKIWLPSLRELDLDPWVYGLVKNKESSGPVYSLNPEWLYSSLGQLNTDSAGGKISNRFLLRSWIGACTGPSGNSAVEGALAEIYLLEEKYIFRSTGRHIATNVGWPALLSYSILPCFCL